MTGDRAPVRESGHDWLPVFVQMLRIGATAFGGGSATIVALRQTCVRRGWLSEAEFLDTVVLSRLTPGITILAQVILIGRSVAGWAGTAAAVIGLLLPSITITTGLAIAYKAVMDQSWAAHPLQLVASVAAGFAVSLALQLFRVTMTNGPRRRGIALFAVYLALGLVAPNPEVLLLASLVTGLVAPRLFLDEEGEPNGP